MKRKALAITLAAVMAMGTCAVTASAADGDTYTIGICQLVQHVALDAATQGFKDEVTKELGEDAVTFDEQNAQGDSNTCSTIVNSFVSNNVDLILANATPALQAAAAGTSDIPILGTSVTEYGVALGLDDFDGTVGGNISGTADLAPLDEQAAMLNELFPDAKNVGLLYCSAEANSQYQVDTVKAALEELGYTCEYYAFSDSNDLSSVVTTAADASVEQKHKYSQRNIDLLDCGGNRLTEVPLETLLSALPQWYKKMVLERDYEAESRLREIGRFREVWFVSCQKLLETQSFTRIFR